MPGASFTVAARGGLRSVAPAGATRTFTRRAEEVPAARRFVRDVLADHPSRCDAELLTCELVTNAVQHATGAARVTVAVMRLGAIVHVDVIDDGCVGLPHWREAGGHDEDGRVSSWSTRSPNAGASSVSAPAPASGSRSRRSCLGFGFSGRLGPDLRVDLARICGSMVPSYTL